MKRNCDNIRRSCGCAQGSDLFSVEIPGIENLDRANQVLEQTRNSGLRYGEVVSC
jgi:hypothetical protein